MVERDLAKVEVVGSRPITRSISAFSTIKRSCSRAATRDVALGINARRLVAACLQKKRRDLDSFDVVRHVNA